MPAAAVKQDVWTFYRFIRCKLWYSHRDQYVIFMKSFIDHGCAILMSSIFAGALYFIEAQLISSHHFTSSQHQFITSHHKLFYHHIFTASLHHIFTASVHHILSSHHNITFSWFNWKGLTFMILRYRFNSFRDLLWTSYIINSWFTYFDALHALHHLLGSLFAVLIFSWASILSQQHS